MRANNKFKPKGCTLVYLTLIGECVDEVIYDAVGAKSLGFGQHTQERGNLQPY